MQWLDKAKRCDVRDIPNVRICIQGYPPGVQLGIFDGRSPIHEKGTLTLFKDDTAI